MKKVFLVLSIAATMLMTFTSCKKEEIKPDDYYVLTGPIYPAPIDNPEPEEPITDSLEIVKFKFNYPIQYNAVNFRVNGELTNYHNYENTIYTLNVHKGDTINVNALIFYHGPKTYELYFSRTTNYDSYYYPYILIGTFNSVSNSTGSDYFIKEIVIN